jgi:hypothetical protein
MYILTVRLFDAVHSEVVFLIAISSSSRHGMLPFPTVDGPIIFDFARSFFS